MTRGAQIALAVAAVVAISAAKNILRAQDIGDTVQVVAVCKDRAMIEQHLKWIVEDEGYERANKDFTRALHSGECVAMPAVISLPIEEVGLRTAVFVDSDGDRVRLAAIRVRNAWTMFLEIFDTAKKT